MFEYSFVSYHESPRPVALAFAGLGEAIILSSLVLVPLLFVRELPERGLLKALVLAPVPMARPAPPPPIVAKAIPHTAPVLRKFNANALVSPVVIPKEIAVINEAPAVAMDAMVGGVPGGLPSAVLPGGGTGFFSGAISVAPPPPLPAPKAAAPSPSAAPTRITVGGDVQAGLILQQVQPIYPALAREGRIAGEVKLAAVIGTDGKIKDLTLISGHPVLVDAAMNAVRHWIYQPTLLNGVPVEVKTEIYVRFKLRS